MAGITQKKLRSYISIAMSFGRSTLVVQRPMKSLSSVCPSVCPSLTFLKIGALVFCDTVHGDG